MVWASNMEVCHDFVDKNIETAEKFHWFGFVGNLRLKLSGSNVKKKEVWSQLFQSSKCQTVVGDFLSLIFLI